jgi:plastocyanin domain-containing protein
MLEKSRLIPLLFLPVLAACGSSEPQPPADGRPTFNVTVTDHYAPAEISAEPNQPIRLVFTRTSDEGCGQQLVFPDLDIRRDLPLNERVAVDLTVPESGRVDFTCGMGHYEGSVVVR